MLAEVRSVGGRYAADGPIGLPKPTPDIDLLSVAESCSTVVIAELRWIRKTVRPAEIPERDADVLKGVGQLESIRAFLARIRITCTPSVDCRIRSTSMSTVQYLLVT